MKVKCLLKLLLVIALFCCGVAESSGEPQVEKRPSLTAIWGFKSTHDKALSIVINNAGAQTVLVSPVVVVEYSNIELPVEALQKTINDGSVRIRFLFVGKREDITLGPMMGQRPRLISIGAGETKTVGVQMRSDIIEAAANSESLRAQLVKDNVVLFETKLQIHDGSWK